MKKSMFAALMCTATHFAMAAPASMILTCDGNLTEQGRNAPAWVPYAPPVAHTETFVINGIRLTSKDVLLSKITFTLCDESATDYVFSSNCKAEPQSYMRRWLGMKDSEVAQKDMLKTYGEDWMTVETIHIDRINLTVNDLYLTPAFDPKPKTGTSSAGKKDYSAQFYVSLNQFRGTCKVDRAKI